MARLNIEDCWWTDPRRDMLIRLIGEGGLDFADIAMIKAWKLAQQYWGRGRQRVPKYIFQTLLHSDKIIECQLAVDEGDVVYIRGSSEYLEWIAEQKETAAENGRKGGLKSAQRPRNEKGQLLSAQNKLQARSKRKPSDAQAKPSKPKLSVSVSVSGSGSVSGSFSGIKKQTKNEKDASPGSPSDPVIVPELVEHSPARDFIAAYCESFKVKYKTNPDITPPVAGVARRLAEALGGDAGPLVRTYLGMDDAWFLTKGHDLFTMESNLTKVRVKHDTGVQITRTDVKHIESNDFHKNQIARIMARGAENG